MEKLLEEMVKRLRAAYGENLRSVLLYGSAARGDFHQSHSDINVMCVLRKVGVEDLEKSFAIAHWWRGRNNPEPLLLAEDELGRATDAFPIEILDLAEHHRVLYGDDPVAGVQVTPLYHRAQVEHELRAKLLRLRQRYAGVYKDRAAVVQLMVDALPSFATLFRHALLVAGHPAPAAKREIFLAAGQTFGFEPSPFLDILEVRAGEKKPRRLDTRRTFEEYLAGVTRMAAAVDGLLVGAPAAAGVPPQENNA